MTAGSKDPCGPEGASQLHFRPFMKVPGFDMSLDEVKASLEPLRRPLSIAILRARNPFNVGAIIRVAHSFLVKQIVLVGDEPFYQRAAMGMQRYENVVYLPDEESLIPWSREHATCPCWCSSASTRASTCGTQSCPKSA
jgi:tRNA G18 (ribose-2'-O)-methylase SpoU